MNTYLVLGHGIEELIDFEARKRIPEGITLVTIAVCGVITTKDEVCPMVRAFTEAENREILENPKKYKKIIQSAFLNGKEIHVYKPGDYYPNLTLQMFLDWPVYKTKEGEEDFLRVFKSGLYKFPGSPETFEISKEKADYCERYFKRFQPYKGFTELLPDDFDAGFMFNGSLLPTTEEVREKISAAGLESDKLKKSLRYPLEAMFDRGGPGVYYYVVCRAFEESESPENLIRGNVLANPEDRYTRFFKKNWVENVGEIAPLLEENLPTLTSWQQNAVKKQLKMYKDFAKIPLLRRQSIVQQGEGRKTRRKQQRKKTRKLKKRT
jgi:hypothetical protein